MMKIRSSILFCMVLGNSGAVYAETPFSGNLAITSDYLFRGLSQTWGKPALQGGVDYNAGRLHVGAWTSNVSRNSYPGGGEEMDVFADAIFWRQGDWSARFGLYAYLYPGADLEHARPALLQRSFDSLEANASVQWKHWTLKYSRSLSDYFGADVEQGYARDTRGTDYLQVDGDMPLSQRWSLHLHAGRTHYPAKLAVPLDNGAVNPDYSDFSLAANCAFAARWSLAATMSHAGNSAFYSDVVSFRDPTSQKNLGGTRTTVTLSTTF